MMPRAFTLTLWSVLAACGNSQKLEATDGPMNVMNVIEQQVIAETLEDGGVVCLVNVRSAEVNLAGTRSARFTATVDVQRSLHGDCGNSLTLAGYARDDRSPLTQGGSYVVAATPSARVAPAMWLEGQAEVSGDVEGVVDSHLAAIQRVTGS